jgi:amidase
VTAFVYDVSFSGVIMRELVVAVLLLSSFARAQSPIDRDLLETDIPHLHALYRSHKYTVTQVVNWYIARIGRYNGIYGALQNLDPDALATAVREDSERAPDFQRQPLWGVPIVIKANTSIEGRITTDGWKGYKLPGKELIAPRDATVVAHLKAAGAVIIGQTNMPDFAASDTNRSSVFGRTGNAYDVRYSPGGSSGGTVTAVTSNLAILGTGTDTGNSIRMPSSTSSVVGVFPTRGLVSIAGIAPLDWLLDNTGPIARNVTDAAIALGAMAGEDTLDQKTAGSAANAQRGPYTQYLKPDALRGKRFGVPAFVMKGTGVPFQGVSPNVSADDVRKLEQEEATPLVPETRAAFMKAVEGLKAAGAEVIFDDSILPDTFCDVAARIYTAPSLRRGI